VTPHLARFGFDDYPLQNLFELLLLHLSKEAIKMKIFVLFSGLLASLIPTVSATEKPISFEFEVGAERDTQLNITEVDQTLDANDTATVVKALLKGKWQPINRLKLQPGYAITNKTYQEHEAFNLQIQQASLDVNYKLDWFELGGSYHQIDAALDREDFMQLDYQNLSISKLFASHYYLRLGATQTDKLFESYPDKNADTNRYEFDGYYFFNRGKGYLSVGYQQLNEDAVVDFHDYQAPTLKATISNKFDLLGWQQKLQFSWSQQTRNYEATHPDIEEHREDARDTMRVSWKLELSESLSATSHYEIVKSQSNLESADFNNSQIAFMLKASF
jgi:hypothetical protein